MFSNEELKLIQSCLESRVKTNKSMLGTYHRFNRTDIPGNLVKDLNLIQVIQSKTIEAVKNTFKECDIEAMKFYKLQNKSNKDIADLYNCNEEVINAILK